MARARQMKRTDIKRADKTHYTRLDFPSEVPFRFTWNGEEKECEKIEIGTAWVKGSLPVTFAYSFKGDGIVRVIDSIKGSFGYFEKNHQKVVRRVLRRYDSQQAA